MKRVKSARYIFRDGPSRKVWEIALSGTGIEQRHGKLAGITKSSTGDRFDSVAEAERAYDALVWDRLQRGYRPEDEDDLQAPIIANPDDEAAYRAYAAFLRDHGDPRGDLIERQMANDPAAEELLAAHPYFFMGPLVRHQRCYTADAPPAFHWRNGFIDRVRLAHSAFIDWEGRLGKDVLAPLLEDASGRFITELTITENEDFDDTLDDIFDVIAKLGMPSLRKLRIGEAPEQLSWYKVGDVGKIWRAVPRLADLYVEAGAFQLGAIELPDLVRAVFMTGGFTRHNLASVTDARWPKIAHLEIFFGEPRYGCDCMPEDLVALLARTNLPALKYLGLKNAEWQNELVPYLARSELVKQLETLDISEGILTDDAIADFEANADAFRHLVLDVTDTYVTKTGVERLSKIARGVIAVNMREDHNPEARFVRVAE